MRRRKIRFLVEKAANSCSTTQKSDSPLSPPEIDFSIPSATRVNFCTDLTIVSVVKERHFGESVNNLA